jgi:hypothetical protein
MVLAVGDIFYKDDAKEVLSHYFKRHNIPHVFIEMYPAELNPKNAHPSWLKLICHKILPGYDAIICWDLDLLPRDPDIRVMHDFNLNSLCLGFDSNAGPLPFCPKFKYNGGLICIPKSFSKIMEYLYDVCAPGVLPSWEQYYLNNMIADNNIHVHELPNDMNTLITAKEFNNARLKHYTGSDIAKKCIYAHKVNYFTRV